MKTFRIIIQGFFLFLFLFLFLRTESQGDDRLGYPVRIFLDFDPLLFVSTLLSSHRVMPGFYLSLILIIATVLLGRIFCGWICPLGTLHNLVGLAGGTRSKAARPSWYRVKYYILLGILAASLFSVQPAGIMDPLSLLVRSLALGIYPAFNSLIRSTFDALYELNPPVIVDISEYIYAILKRSVLSFRQPYFLQGAMFSAIFVGVLLLNLLERRFWCKYLCPLGALLGLLARFSLLKQSVSEGCTSCGACTEICQGGALDGGPGTWNKSECLVCFDCDDICPVGAVSFGLSKGTSAASLNLGRRNILLSLAAGGLSVPLLRTGVLSAEGYFNPRLIRPPGSRDERDFLSRCVRCGECMKVCITGGLQPTLLDAGIEGIWTPMLVPRLGYCEYRCTLCGQVCPTGAIEELSSAGKQKVRIGTAVIDRGRCLPHAFATPCIVCEEVCPTPTKAIWLEWVTVKDREGNTRSLQQPHVDPDLCIGCGICETYCPVRGEPAIYVISAGESRSRDNRILLD